MHFPKFWALGSSGHISCWQWSDQSYADAEQRARESAVRIAKRREAQGAEQIRSYEYGQRALREPIVEEIEGQGSDDQSRAVITRNGYGALVLNTSQICFVDIDLPQSDSTGGGFTGFIAGLFGKKIAALSAEEKALSNINTWFLRNPNWGARVYRTLGGLRLLITSHVLDPESGETEQVFGELGADPLYCRMCKNQKSFRARLTPKPWRAGLENPPGRWPFTDLTSERAFDEWLKKYELIRRQYATCKFISEVGSSTLRQELPAIIKLHDGECGIATELPLA